METPNDICAALALLSNLDTEPVSKRIAAAFLLGYAFARGEIKELMNDVGDKDLMDIVDTIYKHFQAHKEEYLRNIMGVSQ